MSAQVKPEDLTVEMVRGARLASRISREDFEAWSYDIEAAHRVCTAINDYRHMLRFSAIDDPVSSITQARR